MGGTAISRAMVDIHNAVMTGNEDLTKFADVAGMSAEQFAVSWKEDAAGALSADAMDLSIDREDGDEYELLLDEPASTTERYTLPWTDDPIAPCWWVFTTDTTNTDVVRIRFRVRALK